MLVVRISKSLADLLYDSLVESMGTLALVCNRNGPHPIGRRKTTQKHRHYLPKRTDGSFHTIQIGTEIQNVVNIIMTIFPKREADRNVSNHSR